MDNSLLKADNLKKHFPSRRSFRGRVINFVHAVDDVSFSIQRKETLGLVGESGSGKTTLGRLILRLIEPTGGKVYFDGMDVFSLNPEELRTLRRSAQMIFQDPYGSLNPRMTVMGMLAEALAVHRLAKRRGRRERVAELLSLVGLTPEQANRYPHEFSGGQRQRIGIARALAVSPQLIVADEPVSALDISIQAQILNLLHDLQEKLGLTYLFIAHDLSVIRHISSRIAVMYLAKLMEIAPASLLFSHPLHPYTQALLSAIPQPVPGKKKERIILPGDVPSPVSPPAGCRFHTRCPQVMKRCHVEEPVMEEKEEEHFVACHLHYI